MWHAVNSSPQCRKVNCKIWAWRREKDLFSTLLPCCFPSIPQTGPAQGAGAPPSTCGGFFSETWTCQLPWFILSTLQNDLGHILASGTDFCGFHSPTPRYHGQNRSRTGTQKPSHGPLGNHSERIICIRLAQAGQAKPMPEAVSSTKGGPFGFWVNEQSTLVQGTWEQPSMRGPFA